MLHVSNFFANPQATAAAVKINELLEDATGHAGQLFFTNSGAESNECAIKLARKYGGRGRHTVVSALGSFHGRTLATLAATGQPAKHEPFAPMPDGFQHVAWGDLDAMRAAVDGSVAAVMIEADPGRGRRATRHRPGTSRAFATCATRSGALMIVDEIQTGFARTGRWFGFEHDGVTPGCRHAGQGDGQRHAGRRLLGAHRRRGGRSSPATTAAPTAARRSPPRPSAP